MTFQEAVRVLSLRQETRIELGLARVRKNLHRLGDPQEKLSCIHVAGTNGKGSVCAILESVLRQAGYRTGFYSSPHVFDVRERIKVEGVSITREGFARLMARTLRAEAGIRLTYFELLTSIAFQWFREKGVEVVLLETGLGGRLDATNVIKRPLAAVITSIDRDHTQFLGRSLSSIAREKAGIIKPGCPIVCPALNPRALGVIRASAASRRAPLTVVRSPWLSVKVDWQGNRQILRNEQGQDYALGLLGVRQPVNVALARTVLDLIAEGFPVSESAWRKGLEQVRWPGRFEVRSVGGRIVVLDGAHNPEAMEQFCRTWQSAPWAKSPTRWIIGVMKDKDVAGMLKPLAANLRRVVAIAPPSHRALPAQFLAGIICKHVPQARISVARDITRALSDWRRGTEPAAVVFGSFYLLKPAAEALDAIRLSSAASVPALPRTGLAR